MDRFSGWIAPVLMLMMKTRPRLLLPRARLRTVAGSPVISPRVMKVIRRVHLYLGLLLLPWVLLYGATALLFNHSTWMSSRHSQVHGPEVLADTSLSPVFPSRLAEDVAALAGLAVDGTSGEARPALADAVRLTGGYDFRVADAEMSHRVWIGTDGVVRVTSSPREANAVVPIAIPRGARIAAFDRKIEEASAAFESVRGRLGLGSGDVDLRRVPGLRFDVTSGDDQWRADYDGQRGRLSLSSSERGTFKEEARSFLLQLHTSHGYRGGGARLAWAIIVDIMGGAMLLWGVTGLLMWWQLIKTRSVGLVCVIFSAVAAAAIGVGMMSELSG